MGLVQDLRFALRMMARQRAFALVIVTTLALGIAVNATVFAVANAILFKSLPFERPDRVVYVYGSDLAHHNPFLSTSTPDFHDLRGQVTTLSQLAAFRTGNRGIADRVGPPATVNTVSITANAFSLIGQRPFLGRDFTSSDEQPSAPPVVLISYRLWQDRYGGAPTVIGRSILLNDVGMTIVGVMPDRMQFPDRADVWLPLTTDESSKRDQRTLEVFGRLADTATLATAQAEVNVIGQRLATTYPASNTGVSFVVRPYREVATIGPIRALAVVLLGAVTFVLLIACANVANLLLSRSLTRGKEIAIRVAIGASRWRIVRQLLVESLLFCALAGAGSLVLTIWGVRALDRALANVEKPYWISFSIDTTVFVYLIVICVATAIVFGLAPAWRLSRVDANNGLKDEGPAWTGRLRAGVLTRLIVTGEIALTVVLLVAAGLMAQSFLNMSRHNPGVRTTDLATLRLSLERYDTPAARLDYVDRMLARVAAIPGVQAVGIASHLPLGGGNTMTVDLDDRNTAEARERPTVMSLTISPDYFRALGVTLLSGRSFERADGEEGRSVVIVGRRAAAKFWPDQNPIGKRLRQAARGGSPWLTVIGIAPDIVQRTFGPRDELLIYVPYRQDPMSAPAVIARAAIDPTALFTPLRQALHDVDPSVPVFQVRTVEGFVQELRGGFGIFDLLFFTFACVAMSLSAIGLYGVMAQFVSGRLREIGIRLALGATRRQVLGVILSTGLKQLAFGLVLGLAGAWAITRVLRSVLVDVSPTDPITFGAAAMALILVALSACWLPARRATRVDPVQVLRHQ